jgi:hypothetical protein
VTHLESCEIDDRQFQIFASLPEEILSEWAVTRIIDGSGCAFFETRVIAKVFWRENSEFVELGRSARGLAGQSSRVAGIILSEREPPLRWDF